MWLGTVKHEIYHEKVQGTLLIEQHCAQTSNRTIDLPCAVTGVLDLRETGDQLYNATCQYMQGCYLQLNIVSTTLTWAGDGLQLPTSGHLSYPFVRFNGYQ